MIDYEKRARAKGFRAIAGVDEAGRGPLAGPVVAAACLLPESFISEGIDDSKKLSPDERYTFYKQLISHPDIVYGVGIVEAVVIDQINILQATLRAMAIAVARLSFRPDYLLVDGNKAPDFGIETETIIGGDALSVSIAAASIIAKEVRDQIMIGYHELWPQYGFKEHKGYGTEQHLEAIKTYGTCSIHRNSFAPVDEIVGGAK